MAERMRADRAARRVPQPYSRLAFEAQQYAAEQGLGQRWTERMFRAFVVEQRDIGSLDVLADVATHLGLDATGLRSALTSGQYAEAHHKALVRARELDITAVPTFLVDDRRLEGVPTAEGLRRLIDG